MCNYESIFQAITADPQYRRNLDWGQPRKGHPEGTVRAHIEELEQNLKDLAVPQGSEEYWKLMILIHVHDSFKAEATRKVPITDPRSHASLARSFLARHCQDRDLLAMTQLHDEPYAIWRKARTGRGTDESRMQKLLHAIKDWRLFLKFLLIDGSTAGKDAGPLEWAVSEIAPRVGSHAEATESLKLLRGTRRKSRRDRPSQARVEGSAPAGA